MIRLPRWKRAPDDGGSSGGGAGTAAPAADPAQSGSPAATVPDKPQEGAATPPAQNQNPPAKPPLSELLKDPAYRAEHERMISEAATAAQAEATRLANMTAEERAAEERKTFEQERAQFEQERLENEATKQLAALQLPVEFAKQLVGKDAASTLANVQVFGTAFTAAVEAEVATRVKGAPPKTGTPETPSGYIDAKYKNNPYYGKQI